MPIFVLTPLVPYVEHMVTQRFIARREDLACAPTVDAISFCKSDPQALDLYVHFNACSNAYIASTFTL